MRAKHLKLVHDAEPRGPSPDFVRRGRNPDLEPPSKFQPTVKRDGDVVL